MRHGFVRVAAASPSIRVGDCAYNAASICAAMDYADLQAVNLLVLPELSITGSTCGDLFRQRTLLEGAAEALVSIAEHSQKHDLLTFLGLPVAFDGRLYNCAAAVYRGVILGFVPKTYPSHNDDARYFSPALGSNMLLTALGREVPFGTNLLFGCGTVPGLVIGVEIGADLCAPVPPSTFHAANGATVIVNLSASCETISSSDRRRLMVRSQSARLASGYVLAEAGNGESTSGKVFAGHCVVAENGEILAQSRRHLSDLVFTEIDVERIDSARRTIGIPYPPADDRYVRIGFDFNEHETLISRTVKRMPFVPSAPHELARRCADIIGIQARALADRLERAGSAAAVIGVSGGADSTLALLVCNYAMRILGREPDAVIAVNMPGFGSTKRSRDNAKRLSVSLGCTVREISIVDAVTSHFKDIEHDISNLDVVFENAQARERAQILMDIANQSSGMHIGTANLSEQALGWATYGGDHISMYNVNGGVPKTMVRHIIEYIARTSDNGELSAVLKDILECPVSPELLPTNDGRTEQNTEEIVGPYELHDFYLYYMVKWGFPPSKIMRLARIAFEGKYQTDEIKKWFTLFLERFFSQQFKRTCQPEGPQIGSVSLSPRGDWMVPSDVTAALWIAELTNAT